MVASSDTGSDVGRRREAYPGLDIVKFGAAVLVMLFHFGNVIWHPPALTFYGLFGVEVFFILSGIVISHSAEGLTAIAFLRHRALRLYPTAWICATITFAVRIVVHDRPIGELCKLYLKSMLLWPPGPWLNVVYWTLSVELIFYGLILFLLLIQAKRWLIPLCYVLGGTSAAYWIVGSLVAPHFLAAHVWRHWIDLSLISYGLYFAIGMLLYAIRKAGRIDLLVFLGVLSLGGCIEISYKVANQDAFFKTAHSSWPAFFLLIGSIAAMSASLRWEPSSRLAHVMRVIGLMTYPLYLFHADPGVYILVGFLAVLPYFPALAGACLACIGISFFITFGVEPPVRNLLKHALQTSAVIAGGFRLS